MDWLQHTVTPEEAGRTVREIATGSLGVSGRMIQRLTRSRGISLNRKPAQLARKVKAGDEVAVRVGEDADSGLEPVEMELDVVHEDEDVLVVNKPPFLLVHPVAPHHTRTLAHGIAHRLRAAGMRVKVRPVHRLDRDTSGLVLFAKSAFAHQHLDRQLRDRTMRREYIALVDGEMEMDDGVIDAPIGRRRDQPALREVRAGGDDARTSYRVVERLDGATIVALELETGRTHQIRVHLAHLGHPVLGDTQYGGRRVPGIERQALHAWKLRFGQPRTGAEVEVVAELPADLAGARDRLRRSRP
jgi:23S rRNA pseudouridine1911/1915/1917 synthase